MGARFRGRSSADRPANFICASAGRRQEPTSKMVQLPENTVQGTRAISESVMYFGLRRFLARDMSSAPRVPDPQPFSVSAVAFKLQASSFKVDDGALACHISRGTVFATLLRPMTYLSQAPGSKDTSRHLFVATEVLKPRAPKGGPIALLSYKAPRRGG